MLKKLLSILGFIAILIAVAIVGGIGKQLGKAAFSPSKPSAQQIEEKLIEGFTKAAEQSNKRGPVMVDQDTRWDRSAVGPGARLTYFYSLPKYSSREIDRGWLLANLKPEIKKGVCASKEMKPSLQYGATYIYAYSSNDGVEMARFEINKNDCNGIAPAPGLVAFNGLLDHEKAAEYRQEQMPPLQQFIHDTVIKGRRNLPRESPEGVWLVSVDERQNQIVYTFDLVEISPQSLDKDAHNRMRQEVIGTIAFREACQELPTYFRQGMTIAQVYRFRETGQIVTTLVFSKSDC
jgi:hypothetical protein